MAFTGNYKQQATAFQLAADLIVRLGNYATGSAAFNTSVDVSGASDGNPLVSVFPLADGAISTAGHTNAFIRVMDQREGVNAGWSALPGFGSTQQPVYTGTVIQIAFEGNPATANTPTPLTYQNLLALTGDLLRRGARVEWFVSSNGTVPSLTTITGASAPNAFFDPNLYWPIMGRV